VIDFAHLLRRAADSLDDVTNQVRTSRLNDETVTLDTEALSQAFVSVSATAVATLMNLMESVPRPGSQFACKHAESAESDVTADVEQEVDKVIGRMGLVQEDELAALRKRVADLESKLRHAD
jgi:BMFP domain-containing protein YqiC